MFNYKRQMNANVRFIFRFISVSIATVSLMNFQVWLYRKVHVIMITNDFFSIFWYIQEILGFYHL